MSQPGYKWFYPVAMAAEVLCTRWIMVLMRELIARTTRFQMLHRSISSI
ncbi:MAG: DNA-binding HxlR family transcriptional regulator [Lysobacterales bacterium]|jgi:DNA-binding HxlR family transcriptional regulator